MLLWQLAVDVKCRPLRLEGADNKERHGRLKKSNAFDMHWIDS